MAGAGYKLFNTGDVLTAAQVNTYLNEQTVMVFASSAARTSALSGVLAEGMVSYLQDTNAVEVYNGSAWVGVSGAGDITEVQAGVGISIASGTGPIPVITNSSTDLITTAGDLLYGTAADTVARLGIGTAGQVLKVNSGATAPEWGAAGGASGLTRITTNTFSAQTNINLDNVFSATYHNYLVVAYATQSTADSIILRLRTGSTNYTTADQKYGIIYNSYDNAATGSGGTTNTALFQASSGTDRLAFSCIIFNPFAAIRTQAAGNRIDNSIWANWGYSANNTTSYESLNFSVGGGNFTGEISVYGFARS